MFVPNLTWWIHWIRRQRQPFAGPTIPSLLKLTKTNAQELPVVLSSIMLRSHNLQNVSCEKQAKFVQERIISVEKHFAELCTAFGAYTRRIAGLRDKSDELGKVIKSYADSENINKSLKNGLTDFTSTVFTLGDFRDVEVKRLESKVIFELTQYDGICKHAREEVKSTFSAREKEQTKLRHLDRIRARNPHNRQLIIAAEAEVLQASAEVSRTIKVLEEQVEVFEKKKMHDIKSVFLDYITIELSFHAKAIELFTRAYNEIQGIDQESDLSEFRDIVMIPEFTSRLSTVKRSSFRGSSHLGSLANLFTSPTHLSHTHEPAEVSQTNTRAKLNTMSSSVDPLKKGLGSVESVEVHQLDDDASSILFYEDYKYEDCSGDGKGANLPRWPSSSRRL